MPVLCKDFPSITPSTLLPSELADEMPSNMSSGDNTTPIEPGDLRRRRREGVCYSSETIWARMSQVWTRRFVRLDFFAYDITEFELRMP